MAAEARSPRQKRVAGAAVLGGVVAVAWLATSVPRLFESTRIAYVATTSMATGADGLKAGGLVLYGGAPFFASPHKIVANAVAGIDCKTRHQSCCCRRRR